jgi:hypothetical protein
MVDLAAVIWDDYNTTGVPGSGAKLPVKSKIREWGSWLEAVSAINLDAYGAVGNGVTDDSAAIAAAIAAAVAAGIPRVYADAKTYAIGSTIVIGNGSNTAYSTINGVEIVGVGAPFLRLDSVGNRLEDTGTRFKWIGASGGTMFRFRGPLYGGGMRHCGLNGNGLAAKPLELISASRCLFDFLTFAGFSGTGMSFNTVTAESITTAAGVQTEALSCADNTMRNIAMFVADGAIGFDLDGYTGSASNGHDTTRSRFEKVYLIVSRAGGVGVRFGYTDQIIFDLLAMTGFGTSNGLEASLKFVGASTVPSASVFPQNISFEGELDTGQELPIVVSGTIGGGHRLLGRTLFDTQASVPAAALSHIIGEQCEIGTFPKGGFWGDFGLPRHERGSAKNKILNPTFRNSPRGTTWTNPVSGAPLLPASRLVYSSSITSVFSRQPFTAGQLLVPYEPLYFARLAISAASGNTFQYFGWRIGNAEQFNGRYVTFGCWMKTTTSARSVSLRVEQNFGTGGAPSAVVGTTSSENTIGTSWQYVEFTVQLPSTSGKTFGTNGDSYLAIYLSLPLNVVETFEFAFPDFGGGKNRGAFEWPLEQEERLESERYVRLVGAGATGAWSSTTAASLGVVLDPPMGPDAIAPSISSIGGAATVNTPGDGDKTAAAVTAAAGAFTNRGGTVDIGGFTLATALRPAISKTSFIVVSAEF